jgi:hypothetical protein
MLNILWLRCGVAKRLAPLACLQQGRVPGSIPVTLGGATPTRKAEAPPEESHSYLKTPQKYTKQILMPFIISVNFNVYNMRLNSSKN